MTTFEVLRSVDYPALRALNVDWQWGPLDQFWLTITQLHKLWWVQLVALPLALVGLFWRWRLQALKPLAMAALTVGLTDSICYRGIKSVVARPRPYENAEISAWVRRVGPAHGPSFPSNHAANCFAAAGILGYYFARSRKYLYTLAILVALSRPALGVHYPSDVAAGALIGAAVAFFVTSLVIMRIPELRMARSGPGKADGWRARFDQDG